MCSHADAERVAEGYAVIRRDYSAIWGDWFEATGASPATLCLCTECTGSGYRPKRNELHLNLPEDNVVEAVDDAATDPRAAPPACIGWAAWKRELVHELLHEYQHKVVRGKVSPEGRRLGAQHRGCFDGPGHGPDYFTAIAEKAPYFRGIGAETLIDNL